MVFLILREDIPTADQIEFHCLSHDLLLLIYDKDHLQRFIHRIVRSLDLHQKYEHHHRHISQFEDSMVHDKKRLL